MDENWTYGDDLLGDELGDGENVAVTLIRVGARDTEQEGDRVEEVAEDGLESESRFVDVDVSSEPGQNAVDEGDQGNDAEKRGDNGTGNLDSEPSTVGESVQGVLSLVLVVVGDDYATGREGLLGLGVAHLGDGQRSGDGHDARGNKSLTVETEANVTNKCRSRDGSETTGHDLVKLGLGHVRNERSHKHGRFTLADERCGSSDNSFGARDSETPEDKSGELDDEPLDEADVVEHLHERDEEDDGGDDSEEEVSGRGSVGISQEGNTSTRKAKEISGAVGNETEDVVSNGGSQDEQTDHVLGQHAADDSAPVDSLTVTAGDPEDEEEDNHAEQTHGTVLASVVGDLLGHKSANEDSGDGDAGTSKSAQLGGDDLIDLDGAVLPHPFDRGRDVAAGNVEEDQAERDAEPHKEGDDPVLVVAVQDKRGDPPAGEEAEEDEVDQGPAVSVEGTGPATPADDCDAALAVCAGRSI